jgi:mannose-6-phosphate isomerase-like protein (cupin superfamily)
VRYCCAWGRMVMSSPAIAPPLLGKTLGSSIDGFVVAEWQDPGGLTSRERPIAPLHLHRGDDEFWYVLEGVLGVQVGEHEVEAHVGGAVLVPRGTPHKYWNASPERLRYLLVMTTNIHRLIQALHATTDRNPDAMKALFRQFDSELL